MTGRQINYIALTALPLFLLMVAILVVFPELATWLPGQVRGVPAG